MLLAWLLLAARLTWHAAAQLQTGGVDLAIVRSTRELGDAFRNGRQHIEIQQHLDLTAEPTVSGRSDHEPLYQLSSTTRSLRVRFGSWPPPSARRAYTHEQLRARQALLQHLTCT